MHRKTTRGRRPDRSKPTILTAALAGALLPASLALAVDPPAQDWVRTESRADCASYEPLRKPLFGETHVHTKYSADAVLARTKNDPNDAYSFAKGNTVELYPYDGSRTVTLDRPLDFTAVTDHSEGFGEGSICLKGPAAPGFDPYPGYSSAEYPGFNDPICVGLRDTFDNTYSPSNPLPDAFIDFFIALNEEDPQRFSGICGGDKNAGYPDCTAEAGVVWQATQDAAEQNYDRTSACGFTTFVAYEWSGNTNGDNLHRNVIFRNEHVPALPITYYEQWKAEGLWSELKSQCLDAGTGCDVLAIPHNSNIARNGMFSKYDTDGNLLTAEQAATRASMEPIMEVMQVKGDSECRNGVFGTNDELCSFEKLSRTTLLGFSSWSQKFDAAAYARGALKLGLTIEKSIGVNPFALGFVGSTDTHNAVPGATSEYDYGHVGFSGIADSEPQFILSEAQPPSKIQSNGGGLAVVWAEENSRDAIFAAMRRRETYSTSGTRPILRSFAGRYDEGMCDDPEFVAKGYAAGVPMGGDIGPVRGKNSPRFAIYASMDPGTMEHPGTPLQRAQIVKGWLDEKTNETREEVYEVAGDPENGASVDLDTCQEQNADKGFTTLCTVWEDPHFNPAQRAFYYLRVVENPVCRWSHRLCNEIGVDCSGTVAPEYAECCDPMIPQTIQERAVASPIFYHPDRLGVQKGRVSYGKEAGEDKLQLTLYVPKAPAIDPESDDLVISIGDGTTTLWTATIPAGTMDVKKPDAQYQYKDKLGSIAGITGLSLKISKGTATVKLKTGASDLSAITKASQTLVLSLTAGSYSSSVPSDWSFADPKLSLTF